MSSEYWQGARALAPELVLTVAAFVVLLAELFAKHPTPRRSGWLTLFGLFATALALCGTDTTEPGTAFALLQVDRFATYFKLIATVGTAAVVVLWMHAPSAKPALGGDGCFLIMGALLGGFLIVGTNHLLMFVLGFEMLSLASYALAGFDKSRPRSAEAAMKYMVFGSLASALMVFGASLLYGLCGTLDVARLASGDASSGAPGLAAQLGNDALPVALALVLMLAGFAYKISLAPLHFWTPDVYEGAPTPVAAFLAVVSKVLGLGALLRFLAVAFVHVDTPMAMTAYAHQVGLLLAILAAVTMSLGNLAALRQASLKRLLAYSSIAHAGYAVIGAATMDEGGLRAGLLYAAVTAVLTAGGFAALARLEEIVGSDRIEDLRGIGWRAPFLGGAMVVLLAGLTGLPPTLGFYGKYRLFVEGWNADLGWLVLVAAVNTLISLFFYFRIAKALFLGLESPADGPPPPGGRRMLTGLTLFAASASVLLGLWTAPLDRWAAAGMDLLRAGR